MLLFKTAGVLCDNNKSNMQNLYRILMRQTEKFTKENML